MRFVFFKQLLSRQMINNFDFIPLAFWGKRPVRRSNLQPKAIFIDTMKNFLFTVHIPTPESDTYNMSA